MARLHPFFLEGNIFVVAGFVFKKSFFSYGTNPPAAPQSNNRFFETSFIIFLDYSYQQQSSQAPPTNMAAGYNAYQSYSGYPPPTNQGGSGSGTYQSGSYGNMGTQYGQAPPSTTPQTVGYGQQGGDVPPVAPPIMPPIPPSGYPPTGAPPTGEGGASLYPPPGQVLILHI